MYKFSVNDIVGINGDEYRVVRVMPGGVLASWERCADHTQVLSSKDIEIASMLGVLTDVNEFAGGRRPGSRQAWQRTHETRSFRTNPVPTQRSGP